jgi:hypothetical protein
VHGTQLEQDSNAFHALLEQGNITLQGMHGTVLSIRLEPPQPRVHGDSAPWTLATYVVYTLTDKSVSMRPPPSLTRKRASCPA